MAEKGQIPVSWTIEAALDLSAAQYAPVAIDGNGRAVLANIQADAFFGVVYNKPQSGQHATIEKEGITKGRCTGSVTVGDYLTVQSGWFIKGNKATWNASLWTNQGSLTKLVAQALTTVGSGALGTVHLFNHPTMVASN